MKHIIYINEAGASVAAKIQAELKDFRITSIRDFDGKFFNDSEALIFIGALGVCVRMIAPYITDKHTDPGSVCGQCGAQCDFGTFWTRRRRKRSLLGSSPNFGRLSCYHHAERQYGLLGSRHSCRSVRVDL